MSKPPTPAAAVERAKHVFVYIDGSVFDVAALIWTLERGRVDAVVVPYGAPANQAYARALAGAFALEVAEGGWHNKLRGSEQDTSKALVRGTRYSPQWTRVDEVGPWDKSTMTLVHPMWGATEAEALRSLDQMALRTPPGFALRAFDPNDEEELLRTAAAVAGSSEDAAVASFAVLTGEYPADLLRRPPGASSPEPLVERAPPKEGAGKYNLVVDGGSARTRVSVGSAASLQDALVQAAVLSSVRSPLGAIVLVLDGEKVLYAIRAVAPGKPAKALEKKWYTWPAQGAMTHIVTPGPVAFANARGGAVSEDFSKQAKRYAVWSVPPTPGHRGPQKVSLQTDDLSAAIAKAVELAAANPEKRGHGWATSFGARIFDAKGRPATDPVFAYAVVAIQPDVSFDVWTHRAYEPSGSGGAANAFNPPEPPSAAKARRHEKPAIIEE